MAGIVALSLIDKTAFVKTIRLFSSKLFIISDIFLILTFTHQRAETAWIIVI